MRVNKYINNKLKSKINNSDPPPTPEEAYSRYSAMNEEQLLGELFRTSDAARSSGELSNDMLDGFYRNAEAYLTPEQAAKMRALIIELKK